MPAFLYNLRRLCVTFTCSLCLPSLAAFAHTAEEEFSYSRLKDAIKRLNITSVDALLTQHAEVLPDSLRSRYLLIHQSGSLQFGSPMEPRIILFTDAAKFIMAVTGSTSEAGHNTIELIQYNDDHDTFDFKQIVFPTVANEAVVFQDDEDQAKPSVCQNCHGSPSRPNWNPYNLWDGAYGAVDDRIAPDSLEGRNYAAFLAQQRGHGRYAALIGLPSQIGEGFHDKQFYYLSSHDDAYHNINSNDWLRGKDLSYQYRIFPRANYKFTSEVGRLNMRRVARQMLQDPDFPAMKDAIAAALLNCQDPSRFIAADARRQTPERNLAAYVDEAEQAIDAFHADVIASTLANLDWPVDTCRQKPYLPFQEQHAHEINRSDICRYPNLDPNDGSKAGKLAFVYAIMGKALDLQHLATVHSHRGYKFTMGNSGIEWLRSALRELGGLQQDPMYANYLVSEEERKLCYKP